ncbi:MAG: pseudouridine synthase [Candidatus Shikimatogenerans bostrichidophilus]|nr:MAG: pseudouridine synthase [Candidatus Shikimatogenerans bostrichidophilus]
MIKKIRLNHYISQSGICSRRKADDLIKLGLIKVNNLTIKKLGYKVNYNDIIKYNNKILRIKNKIYLILNKPKNCITTIKDNINRVTVMEYIPDVYKNYKINPVGRLDKNTTGILLLTNDGFLSKILTHPKYNIKKIYKIVLNKKIKFNDILNIKNGIKLKEGKVKINNINIIKNNKKIVYLSINIGWNRIIHRLFNKIGYKVLKLKRISFAGIKIDKYIKKEGKFKKLSKNFINKILKLNNIKYNINEKNNNN